MSKIDIFSSFVTQKKRFFLWFLLCFALDRISTYIVLTNGWFGEANPAASLMWNTLGYALSELVSILLAMIIFFYVGVFGSDLAKKYVLPGICLIYSYMMVGNVMAVIFGATGNFEMIKIFGVNEFTLLDWYLYCLFLSVVSVAVLFVIYRLRGEKK